MRGTTHAVRGGQCRNTPDLGHTSGACDVRLRDIERAALEQILEVEPRELALRRGDRDRRRSAYFGLTGVIVREVLARRQRRGPLAAMIRSLKLGTSE